jgi:hypothetical protein
MLLRLKKHVKAKANGLSDDIFVSKGKGLVRLSVRPFKKPSDPARPKNIVFQCANKGFDIVSGKRVNGKLIAPVATMLELNFVVEDISNEIRR